MANRKDFDKKQAYLNQMGEWQKTGRQHTENGNKVKAGYDSVSDDMARMRFQYIRDHTTLPAYFLMVSDMRYGSRIVSQLTTLPNYTHALQLHFRIMSIRNVSGMN
jgi:hypothetical protein